MAYATKSIWHKNEHSTWGPGDGLVSILPRSKLNVKTVRVREHGFNELENDWRLYKDEVNHWEVRRTITLPIEGLVAVQAPVKYA